jgi:hypothetical protein
MTSQRVAPAIWQANVLGFCLIFAGGLASAQATVSHSDFSPTGISAAESSSLSSFQLAPLFNAEASVAPPGASIAGRSDTDQNGSEHQRFYSLSHLAIEAGAGFSAPIGNDTPYITWGGNFTGGAGLHFSQRFTVLGEFQFMDNKLPGAFVAAGGGQTGNTHILSLTVDPVVDLFPKHINSLYVTGGGGYYHKSTNFNVLGGYDFYGYPVYVTANSFSSNQGGLNIGLGFTHRLGGAYGDGKMKLFGEARYVYIHTPAITETNGLGTTELIPVTFGVRW